MFRENFGHVIGKPAAIFKNESIKHTINQISQGPGKYERGTNNKSRVVLFFNNFYYIKNSKNYCSKPE